MFLALSGFLVLSFGESEQCSIVFLVAVLE
jgi:hypothetical protein